MLITAVQQSDSIIYIHTHTHILTYIHILFYILFLLQFIIGYLIQFPLLYNRTLLFIQSKYNGLHLLTSASQLIHHPTPFRLATISLFSISVIPFLFPRQVHLWERLKAFFVSTQKHHLLIKHRQGYVHSQAAPFSKLSAQTICLPFFYSHKGTAQDSFVVVKPINVYAVNSNKRT